MTASPGNKSDQARIKNLKLMAADQNGDNWLRLTLSELYNIWYQQRQFRIIYIKGYTCTNFVLYSYKFIVSTDGFIVWYISSHYRFNLTLSKEKRASTSPKHKWIYLSLE